MIASGSKESLNRALFEHVLWCGTACARDDDRYAFSLQRRICLCEPICDVLAGNKQLGTDLLTAGLEPGA